MAGIAFSLVSTFANISLSYAASALPNLQVTKGSLSDDVAKAGDVITFTATVKNNHRLKKAAASRTEFVLSSDATRDNADSVLGTLATKKLAPGKLVVVSGNITIPAVALGTYQILACADSSNVIKESKERDNCKLVDELLVADTSVVIPTPIPTTPPDATATAIPTTPPDATATAIPTPTSAPQIFSFSPNPIVLGPLATSFNNDEAVASMKILTVTNVSSSTSPSFYNTGYQLSPGTFGGPMASGDISSIGPDYCGTYMTLQPGQSCRMLVWWSPSSSADHVGVIRFYESGIFPVRILDSVPVTMGVPSRPYFNVGAKTFYAQGAGIVRNLDVTLRNIGDMSVGTSTLVVRAAAPSVGDGGFRIDHDYDIGNSCTTKGLLAPNDTCTVRIQFCNSAVGTKTDGWQIYQSNGLTNTPLSPIGTLTGITTAGDGDTCSGYSGER